MFYKYIQCSFLPGVSSWSKGERGRQANDWIQMGLKWKMSTSRRESTTCSGMCTLWLQGVPPGVVPQLCLTLVVTARVSGTELSRVRHGSHSSPAMFRIFPVPKLQSNKRKASHCGMVWAHWKTSGNAFDLVLDLRVMEDIGNCYKCSNRKFIRTQNSKPICASRGWEDR